MLVVLVCISERVRFLSRLYSDCWMITIGSSFMLDRLNWPDPNKFLGFGEPLPILMLYSSQVCSLLVF